jgi:hypothetical protein
LSRFFFRPSVPDEVVVGESCLGNFVEAEHHLLGHY